MKQEYINPFIKASIEVLGQTTGVSFKTGAPYVKKGPYTANNLLIMLGVTGGIRGNVIISMNIDTAKDIASRMMMGMPVDDLNDMSKSALCELGNMIMGNVATLLYNIGLQIDITPPSILTADNLKISPSASVTICVPLESGSHEIVLDISVKED